MTIGFEPLLAQRQVSRRERIAGQLRLFDRQGEVAVSFAGCIAHNLGLDLRKDQVRRGVVSVVRKSADFQWKSDSLVELSLSISHPIMPSLFDRLTERLSTIADRPLTPKELLAALPITNRERPRWTKDNRLKRSGDMKIRQGQIVTIPTYSVAAVEKIRADQTILDRWREADCLAETWTKDR